MGRRRGVSRRSFARRRIRKIVGKWADSPIARIFKVTAGKLGVPVEGLRVGEWEWETLVLLALEVQIFDVLTNWSVPPAQWPYYVMFSKRLWERAMKFGDATFQLEKQSLLNEYVLRGHVLGVLEAVQVHAEAYAQIKKGYLMPSAWAYTDSVGAIFTHEYGGYDRVIGEIYIAEPEGSSGGAYDNRE
ncbi:hypothetical protein ES703_56517 [subsurface metagenome]